MRMRSIASRALLPGLVLCTCFAASAAEPTAKNVKQVRLTPFVLGAASSKAKPVVAPKTEKQALATKRYLRNGVVGMRLSEDRLVNMVEVRNADGTTEIREELEGHPAPVAAPTEAHE